MEVFSQSRLLLPRWVSLLSSWQNLIRTVCVLWTWAILYVFWAIFCIGHSTCLKRQPVSSDSGALDRCGSLRDMLPAVLVYKRDETQGRHNEIPQKIVHHSRTKMQQFYLIHSKVVEGWRHIKACVYEGIWETHSLELRFTWCYSRIKSPFGSAP